MVEFRVFYFDRAQVIPVPPAAGSIEKLINDFGDFLLCSLDAAHANCLSRIMPQRDWR